MEKHRVSSVDAGSIAAALDISAGDFLCTINQEPVCDVIDYESLTACERVVLGMEAADGAPYEAEADKDVYEPLGLNFESGLMSSLRSCKNHCVFCFIDQLPKGGRETLHVKDDDWRLSLIMGNYVTLTNTDDAEFARICKRRVSPLYISVHATDGAVRKRMMSNPTADKLMERLMRLKQEGLRFHAQVVLCPELNDGAVLQKTLDDLYALQPMAASVAVVPVGLTKYREGLYPLRTLTPAEAGAAIDAIEAVAKKSRAAFGTGFAFASDEMYLLAGRELPAYAAYEGFEQIENGVGLLRLFEDGVLYALSEKKPLKKAHIIDSACGVSAAPFLQKLFGRLAEYGIVWRLHPIRNDHFGSSVTVSGLVTGGDIAAQLDGKLTGEALLLPRCMMRERDTTFLDGMTLQELEERVGRPIWAMPSADGEEFIETLFEKLEG